MAGFTCADNATRPFPNMLHVLCYVHVEHSCYAMFIVANRPALCRSLLLFA